MARKIKKQKPAPIVEQAKKPGFPKKKIVIITVSAAVAVALIAAFIIGLVAIINKNRKIDYLNDDLSKYIYISRDDYKNYPVNAELISLNEARDVQREINKLLVKNKNKTPLHDGSGVFGPDITLGDVVNIWYRAYTEDENGIQTELGISNFGNSEAHPLEIGSKSTLIEDIAEGLIGKKLLGDIVRILNSGELNTGDIAYISYNAFLENGTTESVKNLRIDTSDFDAIDKKYGEGFAELLFKKDIGEVLASNKTLRVPGESVDRLYTDLKVLYAVRESAEPYVIDVVFPLDYEAESLRGVKAKFEVYATTAVIYDTPEWNDAFVKEALKETAESLAGYEGNTLAEKYENKILLEVKENIKEANKSLIEKEMWKHYHSKVSVKKLPELEVNEIYRQYLQEVKLQYNLYKELNPSNPSTIDKFAQDYFELPSSKDWREYAMEQSRTAVVERLIFYYIIRMENKIPTSEEYDEIYAEYKDEYMEYYIDLYKAELEACKTEEEKAAKLLEIEEKMLAYYGDEYFEELVYYQYALDYLISFADIK